MKARSSKKTNNKKIRFKKKGPLLRGILGSTSLIVASAIALDHFQTYPSSLEELNLQTTDPVLSQMIDLTEKALACTLLNESETLSVEVKEEISSPYILTASYSSEPSTGYNTDPFPSNNIPEEELAPDQKMDSTTPPLITWHESLTAKEPLSSYVKIGGNYTYVNLKPNGHSSFTGNLGGAEVMYEYKPGNNFYEGLRFSWKQGTTDGSGESRSLLYLDAQERVGYSLKIEKIHFLLSFFSGLGYRHYGQTLKAQNGNSVRFNYNEFYVPVGVASDYTVNDFFALGLGLTWMPQFYPVVSISPLKGSYWKLTNSLSSFSANLPFTITPTKNKKFNIVVDPFYEHWEDGESTAKTSTGIPLGLPANHYNFWGVDVNFVYRF